MSLAWSFLHSLSYLSLMFGRARTMGAGMVAFLLCLCLYLTFVRGVILLGTTEINPTHYSISYFVFVCHLLEYRAMINYLCVKK